MMQPNKIFNHEIWYECESCNLNYDLKETCVCPKCKTPKSGSYGI